MATTVVNVCGTGGWTGPQPGDPETGNIVLHATTAYLGIEVSWNYPTLFPEAVAHTLLYRGTSDNFASSTQRGVVTGSMFFDRIEVTEDTRYYYWIRIVSVNGTLSDLIGPASAVAKVPGEQTIETLTGIITNGVLATALREDIAKITLNYNALMSEIANRIAGNAALSAALAAVQSGLTESLGLIYTETLTRQNGQNALASQMTTIAAVNATNAAAILTESTARVTASNAMATQITGLYAATASATSTANGANTKAEGAAAAVLNEAQVRTSQTAALATQINTVQSTLNGNIASVQVSSQTAITTANSAVALANAASSAAASATGLANTANQSAITSGTQATTAIGQSSLAHALATTANGKALQIGALYTAKVAVNGLVGGFGIFNDGTAIQAGFEVDTFWIGRTAQDKVLPFIVSDGVVYINKARIKNADIDTLKIGGRSATSIDAASGVADASVSVYLSGVSGEIYDVVLMATAQQPQAGFFILYDGYELVRGIGSGLSSIAYRITGAANTYHSYAVHADFAIQCTLTVLVSKR